jgi:uncharacterized membrane protein
MPTARAFRPLDPRGSRMRLGVAALAGIAGWLLAPERLAVHTRALLAWDCAGAVLVGVAALIIFPADTGETKRRAASYDPGRGVVWFIVLAASAFSLFAAIVLMRQPHGTAKANDLHVALCVVTVVMSWLATHSAFTLRYARMYYRDDGDGSPPGGIEFPGNQPPDDLDFAYFAFTLAMCFQVSDATISDRQIRRTALGHAALSFIYNTVILALVLNLVVGSLG